MIGGMGVDGVTLGVPRKLDGESIGGGALGCGRGAGGGVNVGPVLRGAVPN